jgi:hypothetical protein
MKTFKNMSADELKAHILKKGTKKKGFLKGLKKGALHKTLGVKAGAKIPASKLAIKATDSPLEKKRKQFALNASKWHK